MRTIHLLSAVMALGSLTTLLVGSPTNAQEDRKDELSPFSKLASTPSRLTMFNSHDDARQGAYNCSKERAVIEAALKQTRSFLTLHPESDYADNSLFHMVRIASQGNNVRVQLDALRQLADFYSTSDLADDALWGIAARIPSDSTIADKAGLLERLIREYPTSGYVPRALVALCATYRDRRDPGAAVDVARELVNRFPHADGCAAVLAGVGDFYRDNGRFDEAIATYNELLDRYPFSDFADDALFSIGTCYRAQNAWGGACDAYAALLDIFPGSPHSKEVWRELNVRSPGRFDLEAPCPCEIAKSIYDQAEEMQKLRRFQGAVEAYQEILMNFRGVDFYDDALYHIGQCFEELDILGMTLSQAKGPDDRFSRQEEWAEATGIPVIPEGEISATADAVSAYLMLANNFIGSDLRDDALHRIHELFKERKMVEDEALVLQDLLVGFPGSPFDCEATYTVLKWYAEEAKYPDCIQPYRQLSSSWPNLFPWEITVSEDEFRAMMRYYLQGAGLAYKEVDKYHIGYSFGPPDLADDAAYYLGNIQVSYGKTKDGIRTLSQLLDRPSSDQAAFAYFCIARASERIGERERASDVFQRITADKSLSGLADDATRELETLALATSLPDTSAWAKQAEDAIGKPVSMYDMYVGDHVVVFCPFGYTALMRAYNLPNIWDTAQGSLADWTGLEDALETKQIIVMDTAPGSQAGKIIRLPVNALNDPPQWDVGLAQLAENFLSDKKMQLLRDMGQPVVSAFVRLAAASLQYELVSETRDTIGNPSAVKLPFENLIREREHCMNALDQYVREGANFEQLNPDVMTGMLLTLLDTTGYGNNALVDWSPFKRFFQALADTGPSPRPAASERDRTAVFVRCLNEAFNTDVTQQFVDWGFDIRKGDAVKTARAAG